MISSSRSAVLGVAIIALMAIGKGCAMHGSGRLVESLAGGGVPSAGVFTATADSPPLTAKSVTDAVVKSMKSSSAFHISARLAREGKEYDLEAWMTPHEFSQYVFEKESLIFAQRCQGLHRQEFVPIAPKKFGDLTKDILVEYTVTNEFDTWSRFMDHDFACGVLGAIGDSWLRSSEIAEGVESKYADGTLSEEIVRGIPCYKLHEESRHGATDSSYDLYVDKVSFLPLRQTHKSVGPDVWSKDYVLELSVHRLDLATPIPPLTVADLKTAKPGWPSNKENP